MRLKILVVVMLALGLVLAWVTTRRWMARARHTPAIVVPGSHGDNAAVVERARAQILEAEQWLVSHPDDATIRFEVARLHFISRNFPAAIDHLTRLKLLQPKNADVHVRLAMAQKQASQLEEALTNIERALELDPQNRMAQYWRAEILLAQGRSEEALAEFRAHLKHEPKSVAALIGEARSLEQLRSAKRYVNSPEMVAPLERAVQLQPSNVEATTILARMAYMYLQQFDRAEKLAREAARLDGTKAKPHMILVEIILARGATDRLTEADEEARRAVAIDPRSAEPLYLLGRVQWRQDQCREAIANLEQSWRIKPLPQTIYLLSQAYRRAGDEKKAAAARAVFNRWSEFMEKLQTLQADLQRRPRDTGVYCQLAELHLSTGDTEHALMWLRKSFHLDRNNVRVRKLLARVEEEKKSGSRRSQFEALDWLDTTTTTTGAS